MPVDVPALEAYALTKSRKTADGSSAIWRFPDVVVAPGQFVTLLAEQAADAELVMGILSGLTEPAGGVLRVAGQDVGDLDRTKRAKVRARDVGFLFRDPKLLSELSVLQNVAFPARCAGVPRRKAEERARAVLDELGLNHLLTEKPADLCPLEGQRAALARALVNDPAIILAHEPTAHLPPEQAENFMELLRQVSREKNVAVLLGTSDPQLAGSSDHTIHIRASTAQLLPLEQEDLSTNDLFSELYEAEISPIIRPLDPLLDYVLKPLSYTAVVGLIVVFLTLFGLTMANASRAGASVDFGSVISHSVSQFTDYIGNLVRGDLGLYQPDRSYVYYWGRRSATPIAEAVGRTVYKSLALLLLSMILGGVIGVPLGLIAAVFRHRKFSLAFITASIVGVSTPSFFLALLLQILEVNFYRRAGFALFPVGGFGWDSHIVLPALVLAARPIAQVARVSFVALATVLDADYVRTATAKGLTTRAVLSRHVLRNAGVATLTALGTSLRFSLSSLPVVETIFQWPGMGELLLSAIRGHEIRLAATLTMILGVFFVLVQVALDQLYKLLDPRLRQVKTSLRVRGSWTDIIGKSWAGLRGVPGRIESLLPRRQEREQDLLPPLPTAKAPDSVSLQEQKRRDAKIKHERQRAWVQSTVGSLPFILGTLVLLIILGMVIFGQQLAPHSPFSPVSSRTIDGVLSYAPYPPSAEFPLGTDQQGRDILSLLLYGARRTLSLAFFAVVARLLLGTTVGALAGWFPGSLLDRALSALTQVIAAFPSLLLTMVLIHAFGLQQGLWVFAAALCLIGWGETAQFVRGEVMQIREQDYIEGALSVGLGDAQLLARHVLPNLVPSLVVLACLEMGGVLMILGELGFIGVFIGGGATARIVGDSVVTYFDVPEWGVMLSNTWRRARSYPWMTFYPALAFTISILGFNLFGEGLRRLTERLTLSMHRIINRYTVGAALGIGALLLFAVEGTGSWAQFAPLATQFDTERAMADVRYLASPQLGGRAPGSAESEAAAWYIAQEFAALGLQPAGPEVDGALSYFVPVSHDYRELTSKPLLELRDRNGQPLETLVYRRDYAEMPNLVATVEPTPTEIICLGMHTGEGAWPEDMEGDLSELMDKTVLVVTPWIPWQLWGLQFHAVLVVAPDDDYITHRELSVQRGTNAYGRKRNAVMYISPETADTILRQGGSSLEEVTEQQSRLQKNEGFLLHTTPA